MGEAKVVDLVIGRSAIVAAARRWIGTPYVHQASCFGAGCDCLGLVRGVWRDIIGDEPEKAPPYTPDWAEMTGRETLLETAERHLQRIDLGTAHAGDVVLFRWRPEFPVKHVAILSDAGTMIHAYENHEVQEVMIPPTWRRRMVAAFAFPGVT